MYKPKKISDFTNKIVNPIIQKKSFLFSRILMLWQELIGENEVFCEPIKIVDNSNKKSLKSLHVRLNSAYAPEFNFKSIRVIEKINSHFGYKVIDKIILHHDDNFNHSKESDIKINKNIFKSSKKSVVNLSKIDDPNLSKSLKELEKVIFSSYELID